VVPVDPQPADPAVLLPARIEQVQILVVDLNAVVRPIRHEEPSLRVERQSVRLDEFPRRAPALAGLFEELAGLVELAQPLHRGGVAVALDDADVAARIWAD